MKHKSIALLLLLAHAFVAYISIFGSDRKALTAIVRDTCHPEDQERALLAPCQRVDAANGYVVIKDRKGSAHHLLIPTESLSGIESPRLLENDIPNYFKLAWTERAFISRDRGDISEQMISLVINSRDGRSQDLLHIHIACLRSDVRHSLDGLDQAPEDSWMRLPVQLRGHQYWMRSMTAVRMERETPFEALASGLPGARANMGSFSVAVIKAEEGFLLLATQRDLFDFNFASAGELQDYDCGSSGSAP
jgi:CDP-diacylglycerol pyrophosphatase